MTRDGSGGARGEAGLPAALGGAGWSPRGADLSEERGSIWGDFGVEAEWAPLRAVLLHAPGPELGTGGDPGKVQMLGRPDPGRAREEHLRLAAAYRDAGVEVHQVEPERPSPNLLFVADLFFMTPQGAILARPASTVRAGEEVEAARALARLRIPILGSVHGRGVFEGADALWLDGDTVVLAEGLRTNGAGASQVARILADLGVTVIRVRLGRGTMHLMGTVRLLDRDLAVVRAGLVPARVVRLLGSRGFRVLEADAREELAVGQAMNVVPLAPRKVLMPAGQPATRSLLERAGVEVIPVEIGELAKGAGGVACMTGVLRRGFHRGA